MFGIKYETWVDVCDMYFSLKTGTLKSYLQWFPFTKLTNANKETIKSKDFFEKYIDSAAFVLLEPAIHQSENYLQKGDGSFRDSSLVSPVLYLILQSIGKGIAEEYKEKRPSDISVYYAGNYEHMRPRYKQDYDKFFKELNSCIDEYQYFIKTDITNFFSNINVDKLIARIDMVCNSEDVAFSQTQLQLFKELLKYCGNGRFPLIENSIASSFLSTIVYLDEVDSKLHKFITEKVPIITEFRIVRYVDDMYILISSSNSSKYLPDAYNEIRNEYSSILKEYGLALNTKKCCLKKTTEINQELKKSLYDEYFKGKKHNIEELFAGEMQRFLKDLSIELLLDSVDIETYNGLIDKHFSSDDIEFTSNEVFNYYVYENQTELQTEAVIKEIIELVDQSISFISLDPKRLTIMIMKTKSGLTIRKFLNQLFNRNRENKWNSYDTTIAISYLMQREFKHIDLLDILSNRHPELYSYYWNNCKDSFLYGFCQKRVNKLSEVIAKDWKTLYLYYMYLCENKRENYMAAYAYFKNFFDRVTADLAFFYCQLSKKGKPDYKKFYREGTLASFYSDIIDSESIIKLSHKLRNANPLAHSSSELIDRESTTEDIKRSIKDLNELILKFVELNSK